MPALCSAQHRLASARCHPSAGTRCIGWARHGRLPPTYHPLHAARQRVSSSPPRSPSCMQEQ
eukprot:364753-Chlamydomonas_euryale.AAC.9